MAISDWSTTPALNATQPGVNMATGAAPSTVHPSIRQIMADTRTLYDQVQSVGGATIQAANDEVIQGREYLTAFINRILANSDHKIIMSGDSTTSGAFTSANLTPDKVLLDELRNRGLANGIVVNSGWSGESTAQWLNTHLAVDLAAAPTLYIIRWGLNDTSGSNTDAQNAAITINNIATGLTTIRSGTTALTLPILLCTPNTAYDAPVGRTPGYFDLVSSGLRALARTYKCGFIDIHKFMQDASFGGWINQDYSAGSGRYVHPLDQGNAMIFSLYADALMPMTSVSKFKTQNIVYPYGMLLPTDLGTAYPPGLTMRSCLSSDGWPYQGVVETYVHASGYARQVCWMAEGNSPPPTSYKYAQRFWSNLLTGAWGPWQYVVGNPLEDVPPTSPTMLNGWTAATVRYFRHGGVGGLSGSVSGGTITDGTPLFVLPASLTPSLARFVPIAVSKVGGGYTAAALAIQTTGSVQVFGLGNNTFASLDGVTFSL